MDLTRFFLLLFVGTLAAFALVASGIVLLGSGSDTEMSLLLSVAAGASFSLLALWIATIYQTPGYKSVSLVGLVFCSIGFFMAVLTNWHVLTPGSGILYPMRFSFFTITVAFALSALLLRIQRITPGVSKVRAATTALLALDAILLNLVILGFTSFSSVSKFVWVISIFGTAGLFLVPVLCRLNKQQNRRASDRKAD